MNIIDKTIFDSIVQYSEKNDWIKFDGNEFHLNQEKLNGISMHKYSNLSLTDALVCLKTYLKHTVKSNVKDESY